MHGDQFRVAASQLAEYITNYLDNIRERPVLPDVQPFYLQELVPESPPDEPESWDAIFGDIERVILPGMTHWHSPRFNAYFPTANSYPAILADMLSAALGCIGFTWVASPACTELEMRMMDWLGRMLNLPDEFLFSSNGHGGGVIQGTASEATLVTLLAARNKTLSLQDGFSSTGIPSASVDKSGLLEKLVAYCSSQAHSSVERAGLLGAVRFRLLDTDDSLSLRGHTLKDAIERDQAAGLIPFYVVATLGTTNSCAFDNLQELGEICHQKKLWLHVDAAYAGSAFICPEFRHLLNGIELADSFNLNPHKWLMVNFDCSALWLKDRGSLVNSFNVDPVYLKHDKQGQIPDYRHWQIPLGRRFRSLKMWFVMRSYGVKGLQEHIRKQVKLAHEFESLVKTDSRFELKHPVIMGLVTFRLKGSNEMNEQFVKAINQRRNIHITPTKIKGEFIIRFAVCARTTVSSDIEFAWSELRSVANNFAPSVTTSG